VFRDALIQIQVARVADDGGQHRVRDQDGKRSRNGARPCRVEQQQLEPRRASADDGEAGPRGLPSHFARWHGPTPGARADRNHLLGPEQGRPIANMTNWRSRLQASEDKAFS